MATSNMEGHRQTQLEAYIPNVWKGRRFLYVGASVDQFELKYGLLLAYDFYNAQVDVMEIDSDRATELMHREQWLRKVITEDVSNIHMGLIDNKYDATLWVNGPGILEPAKIDSALQKLERISALVVLINPWGNYPYRNGEDELLNPLDVYRTPLTPQFFLRRGYAVHLIGEPDTKGGNLLAWKRPLVEPLPWRRSPCPEEDLPQR